MSWEQQAGSAGPRSHTAAWFDVWWHDYFVKDSREDATTLWEGIYCSLCRRPAALQHSSLEPERKISLVWRIAGVGCLGKGDTWIRLFCSLVHLWPGWGTLVPSMIAVCCARARLWIEHLSVEVPVSKMKISSFILRVHGTTASNTVHCCIEGSTGALAHCCRNDHAGSVCPLPPACATAADLIAFTSALYAVDIHS